MEPMDFEKSISQCPVGSDTPPEVEEVQIELLRKAGSARRLRMAISLSEEVMNLSRRALRRANPGLSETELKVLYVKTCYGEELGEKFKKALIKRGKE